MSPGFGVGRLLSGMAQGFVEEDNHPAETVVGFGLGLEAVMVNEYQ